MAEHVLLEAGDVNETVIDESATNRAEVGKALYFTAQ